MRRKSLLIGIMCLAIGFAAVTTTLVNNGILAVLESDDFEIIFTSAKLDGIIKKDFISQDKKHIEFVSSTLTNVGDESVLVYEVTNTSRNYDANVSVECVAAENDYIIFEYDPREMMVLAGETKKGTLKASMVNVTATDMDIPLECTLIAEAAERESLGEEYVAPFSRSGEMMAVPAPNKDQKYWAYKSNITKVVFEDKMTVHETSDDLTFDVSYSQDESVMAYLVANGETLTINKDADNNDLEDTIAYDLYIQSDTGVVANSNGYNLFKNFNNIVVFDGLEFFDTSNVTNMSGMFSDCNNLSELDLSNFDTSNVTNMSSMFSYCYELEVLDLGSFDTKNVTTMAMMFGTDNSFSAVSKHLLKEIRGIEKFDTSNVVDMYNMFNNCRSLTKLNIGNWNTSKLTRTTGMFSVCDKLESVELGNWNLSKVNDISLMFYRCGALVSLDVAKWDTSNITGMQSVFGHCDSLISLDVSNWNTSKVTNMMNMFGYCNNLSALNVSKWNVSNVTNMNNLFYFCFNLVALDVSNWNTSKVKDMTNMFSRCSKLALLDVSNWDTSSAISLSGTFYGCSSLSLLNVSNWSISNVTNINNVFYGCKKLKALDVARWNTSSVINMSGAFAYCENLEALNVSNWDTSSVTDMSSMFGYLRKVGELDVSNWNTSNVTTMRAMFVECNALTTADLSNFDLTNVTNLNSFIAGCHNLVAEFTIRGTKCTKFAGEDGYWSIFTNTAIGSGKIIVNYTADASNLVDEMIVTKSEKSNVVKGTEVI